VGTTLLERVGVAMVFYYLFKRNFASTVRRVSVGVADLENGGFA